MFKNNKFMPLQWDILVHFPKMIFERLFDVWKDVEMLISLWYDDMCMWYVKGQHENTRNSHPTIQPICFKEAGKCVTKLQIHNCSTLTILCRLYSGQLPRTILLIGDMNCCWQLPYLESYARAAQSDSLSEQCWWWSGLGSGALFASNLMFDA